MTGTAPPTSLIGRCGIAERELLVAPLLLCLLSASCCKKPPPPPAPPAVVPQSPVELGPAPSLPFPPTVAFEAARDRVAGTSGGFVLGELPSPAEPVRGALIPWHDGSTSFQPHAPRAAAALGDGDWLVVLAQSGLWLLEASTMAVRGRLDATATTDLVASVDGSRFAYGRCGKDDCSLVLRSFPELAVLGTVAIDPPRRLRFSDDGSHVAVASESKNSAMIVEVATGQSWRVRANNDVNDAAIVSVEKKWVAFGTDDDSALIVNWASGDQVFDTLPETLRHSRRGYDQNAVVYDARLDELLFGGNDNIVWRFGDVRTGAPRYLGHREFANDVESLALLADGDTLVGLDCGSAEIMGPTGGVSQVLGKSVGMISWGARVQVGRTQEVLAVLGGTVARWMPGLRSVRQSSFFSLAHDWEKTYTSRDVVLMASAREARHTFVLQRAVIDGADPLDVTARSIGKLTFETHSPEGVVLDDGTRLYVGEGRDERIRVYRLPLGGGPSAAEDVPEVPYQFLPHTVRADGKRVGIVGRGIAAEIDAKSTRVIGTIGRDDRLVWSDKEGVWQACGRGPCRRIVPGR